MINNPVFFLSYLSLVVSLQPVTHMRKANKNICRHTNIAEWNVNCVCQFRACFDLLWKSNGDKSVEIEPFNQLHKQAEANNRRSASQMNQKPKAHTAEKPASKRETFTLRQVNAFRGV